MVQKCTPNPGSNVGVLHFGGGMFSLSFEIDTVPLERDLTTWARGRMPSILRNALNDTGKDVMEAERAKIAGVFDRPTPFIRKAVIFPAALKATRDNLVATVKVRDEATGTPPSKFLRSEVSGGPRKPKAFELRLRRAGIMAEDEFATIAMGFRRDQYGNIPGSTLVAILSQLGAAEQFAGYKMNETAASRKRAGSRRTKRYFVPRAGTGLRRGIYERQGKALRAVMIFVRQPTYRARYDFGQAAEAKAKRAFPAHFARYFEAERAKRAGGSS